MTELDIYSYLDYRAFCRDFYRREKLNTPKFSFRTFAKKASIASSYFKHIMDGTRNLSPEMSIRFAHGMDLNPKEIDYFENLVRFNQASSLEEKALYFERLRRKRARALKPIGLTEAVDLLSHWYVVAIKELVVNLNSDDYRLIQKLLRKKLPESIVEKAIEDLKALGWITYQNNRWVSSASQIQFPDEVKSYVVRSFHQQMLELSIEGLEDELSEREYGAAIFTFPAAAFSQLKEKIKEMQRDFVSFVQDLNATETLGELGRDEKDLRVYHFGVQCFSLQKEIFETDRKEKENVSANA